MVSSPVVIPASAEETAPDSPDYAAQEYFEEEQVIFSDAQQPQEVQIPNTVSEDTFGDFDYELDTSVDEITITKYNGSQTNVTIPAEIDGYKVVKIGNDAFIDYAKLTSVTIPDGVTAIGTRAFRGCERLESAVLPDSIESIGTEAFLGCKKLGSINFPANWVRTDNWGYGNIWRDCDKITSVTVPEGVEIIPDYAFDGMNHLKTVTLPSTLKTIGVRAFRYCEALTKIAIPSSVETISESAFEDCVKLLDIDFPSKLTYVGYAAFNKCERLETADLPDSVETIGRYAFANCTKLVSFNYPAKWERLDDSNYGRIFENCENLTEITVPEGVKTLPDAAFDGNNFITKINLPSTLTKIGSRSLAWCVNLKEVKIPAKVASIGEYAFEGDEQLKEITLPDGLEKIEPYTFKNCKKLDTVNFPEKLTSIGREAFCYCEKMEAFDNIPDSVEFIGRAAFYGCKSLSSFHYPLKWETTEEWDGGQIFKECENLTEITVPEGIKTLPSFVFDQCNYLEKINLPSTLTKLEHRSMSYCDNLKSITLTPNLKFIGEEVFKGSALTEVIIPDGFTEIADRMFEDCKKLEKVTFPKTLTKIGYAAFDGCEKLEAAELPDSVEIIGRYAFSNCKALTSFHFPKKWASLDDNNYGRIFENCESLTEITVPDGTKALPDCAFDGCNCLTRITLPSSLTKIGKKSIAYCEKLTEVNLPSSVKTISDEALRGNPQLTEIVIPSNVTEIGQSAFEDCEKLETVTFPEKLVTLGNYAFCNCKKLRNADLPDTVEKIGKGAFEGCKSLATFHYPAKWEKTEDWDGGRIFKDCENLNTITVPEGTKEIPEYAFQEANYLETVSLPASLTTVGRYAFSRCDRLKEVTLPVTIKTIGEGAFENDPMLTLYCPKYSKGVIDFIDNRINVVSNDDSRRGAAKALDEGLSSYSLQSGAHINVTCSYAVKSSVFSNASDIEVKLYIPDDSSVTKDSVYLNGKLLTGDDYSEDDNHIYVPITKRTGKISFSLDTEADCRLQTYAVLTYYYNGKDDFDIIDIINEDYELVTLNAEDIVSSSSIEVSGIAPAENEVNIYVDGEITDTVKANKAGMYTSKFKLPGVTEGAMYQLSAETVDKSGSTMTAKKIVKYSAHAPQLTDFTMEYNGLSYDMLSGKKHNVTFVLEAPHKPTPFKFSVKYKNADNLEKVYITSTRNHNTKKMLAVYDENTGNFVASGYFDNNDHDYVPGRIGVEYLEKHKYTPVAFSSLDKLYSQDMLPDALKKATFELTTDEENVKQVVITSDDGDTITYTYERLTPAAFKKAYESSHKFTRKDDNTATGLIKDLIDYGWAVREDGKGASYAEFDRNAGENTTILWSYQSANDYIEKETIEFGGGTLSKSDLLHVSEDDLARVMKWGLDYAATDEDELIYWAGYTINYAKAKTEIMASSASPAKKNAELETLNEMRRLAREMTSAKLIGAYLTKLAGYQFGTTPALSIAVYTININITVNIKIPAPDTDVDKDSDNDNDNGDGDNGNVDTDNPDNDNGGETPDTPTAESPDDAEPGDSDTPGDSDGDSQGDGDGDGDFASGHAETTSSYSKNSLSFAIDPSGYVYEGVTENRVAQATVTAYWVPYDPEVDGDSYWEKPDESKATVWNAADYGAENPLKTDNSGNYRWDVPEGWWRVTAEKDGYELYTSDWMKVPPPQTDVNICLSSQAAPKVESAEVNGKTITVTFNMYMDPETVSNIKVTGADGKELSYKLSYSDSETNADGTVFAKKFDLTLDKGSEKVTVSVPDSVKSYCGVSAEAYSSEFEMKAAEPDTDTKDTDKKDTDTKDTDTKDTDTKDTDNKDTDNKDTDVKDSDSDTDTQPAEGNLGDLDGDGEITSGDALAVLRMSVGAAEITDENKPLADVDEDGEITAGDALEVLRFSVGLSNNDRINKPLIA